MNIKKLHDLFMSGMPIKHIAGELGIPESSCSKHISELRKNDPDKWPKRVKAAIPTVPMHLYECTDCFCTFGVEDDDGIDQTVVICPHCHTDELLQDRGHGFFTVTIPAEEEAS